MCSLVVIDYPSCFEPTPTNDFAAKKIWVTILLALYTKGFGRLCFKDVKDTPNSSMERFLFIYFGAKALLAALNTRGYLFYGSLDVYCVFSFCLV